MVDEYTESDRAYHRALDPTIPEDERPVTYETTAPAPGPMTADEVPPRTTYATTPPPPRAYEREAVVEEPVERPRFSVAAGFFGWAVAMWFTLLFTTIVLAFLGNSAYLNTNVNGNTVSISQPVLNDLAWTGVIGGAIALFLAYFLGGYAAGRIGRWDGAWHGLAVVAWTVVFAILGAVLTNYAATQANVGAYLSSYNINWSQVTTNTVVTLAVMLLIMLVGAILGGMLGDNLYARELAVEPGRYAYRGRPRV